MHIYDALMAAVQHTTDCLLIPPTPPVRNNKMKSILRVLFMCVVVIGMQSTEYRILLAREGGEIRGPGNDSDDETFCEIYKEKTERASQNCYRICGRVYGRCIVSTNRRHQVCLRSCSIVPGIEDIICRPACDELAKIQKRRCDKGESDCSQQCDRIRVDPIFGC